MSLLKKYYSALAIPLMALAISCGDSNNDIDVDNSFLPAIAEFSVSAIDVSEKEKSLIVNIQLDRPAPEDGTIKIDINNISAEYESNYLLSTTPIDNSISLNVSKEDTKVFFEVILIDDGNENEEQVEFTMTSASGGIRLANRNILLLTITDESFVADTKYENCLDPLESDELNVVTWNIEFFPMNGSTTISLVSEIIENMNADVIAVQEINSISNFNTLVDGLVGWEGQIINLSGSLDIGYLYKTSEISVVSDAKVSVSSVSPRPPVEITLKHKDGLEVTLLNIHLKCCGGSSNISRRATASAAIKDYIDQNLPNDNVILLGDFNGGINTSPFDNFRTDVDNYLFADAEIEAGSQSNWSYPSWPSHLDHILITNELVDNLVAVKTLRLNVCLSNYLSVVSDHRPVMATFR